MRSFLVISLAVLMQIVAMSDTATYLFFKLNQSEIIRFCCVHNSAPGDSCHGACFLKKKLEDQNSPSSTNQKKFPIPVSKQLIKEIVTVELLSTLVSNISILSFLAYRIEQETCESQDFIRKIIDPPEG